MVHLLLSTYQHKEHVQRDTACRLIHITASVYKVDELTRFRAEQSLLGEATSSDWLISSLVAEKLPHKALEKLQLKASSQYLTLAEIRKKLTSSDNNTNVLSIKDSAGIANTTQTKHVPDVSSSPVGMAVISATSPTTD